MTSEDQESAGAKQSRERSPSFPFISLRTAVDRLIAFDSKFGRHPVPALKAGLAWSMKPESSQAGQTLAALKSFGMVDYAGAGTSRAASLTDEARTFLRAQQESVKAPLLKSWALRPKNLARYFSLWGRGRPINEICLDTLVLNGGFTEPAAKLFLRVYDDSLAFAGLADDDNRSPNEDDEPVSEGYVESGSALLRKEDMATSPLQLALSGTPLVPGARGSTKQDTFTLDEGAAVLQWPSQMSEASYEDFKDWIDLQMRKIKRSIQ